MVRSNRRSRRRINVPAALASRLMPDANGEVAVNEPDKRDGPSPVPGGLPAEQEPVGRVRPARTTNGAGAGALAVAALAVGVLACAFSWMFFIQTWIVLAGLVAAALGLLGVVVARRGEH